MARFVYKGRVPKGIPASPESFLGKIDRRTDEQALEDFVLNNPELNALETLLSEFNIFEAMRAERTEIRHSDFLAFLLDPSRPHGLGDLVLKSFLQAVLKTKGDYPSGVTPIDLDSWNMGGAVVSREEADTDISIRYENSQRKLVVIIENKIDSNEHSDQLRRYYDGAAATIRDSQIIAVYLTPEGDPPSDDRFLPLDYGAVASILESVLKRFQSQLGEGVALALKHYVGMLRRHIVTESDIARLSKVILTKHKRALDIIFNHRPDTRSIISDQLAGMIKLTPEVTLLGSTKSRVSFHINSLRDIPKMESGEPNYYINGSKHMLYVEFNITEREVGCRIVVGPGPIGLRTKIVAQARKSPQLFAAARGAITEKFKTILSKKVLRKNEMSMDGPISMDMRLSRWWTEFRSHTMPAIDKAFSGFSLD